MGIWRSFSTFVRQKSEMVGRKGDMHLVIGRLINSRPPAHTMSTNSAANGVFDQVKPLFVKDTHIHHTDFSLTIGGGTTAVYAGLGLNLNAPTDSAFQLLSYSGCKVEFKM